MISIDINEEHGSRASMVVEDSISVMTTGKTGQFEPLMVLEVFPKLMNTMLLEVLSERIHASDKALCGYLCFHRWMLYFAEQYPVVLETVNTIVNNFVRDERDRHKSVVPSLGEFLPLLSLSDKTWDDVMHAYLSENLDRNVFWVLRKCPKFIKNREVLNESQIQQFFDLVALGSMYLRFRM